MSYITAMALVAALITVGFLVAGISAMVADGEVARHRSEEWMTLRVLGQGVVLLFFVLSQFP